MLRVALLIVALFALAAGVPTGKAPNLAKKGLELDAAAGIYGACPNGVTGRTYTDKFCYNSGFLTEADCNSAYARQANNKPEKDLAAGDVLLCEWKWVPRKGRNACALGSNAKSCPTA
jgi:hypothetical protein